jgi:hypothetical protein
MPLGRVGSTLMISILTQSLADERLKLSNEIFTVHPEWTADQQDAALTKHYELAGRPSGATHIGGKESADAMADPDRISALCATGGIRVVRMRRANLVKAAVSQIRARRYAERTGEWAVRAGMTPLEPIAIDPELLLRRIDEMDRADRRLMTMFGGCTVVDVEYQELLDDLHGVAHRVRDVLGIPQRPFRVRHEKATPDDLAAAIPNLDEVARALAGTPWADQLASAAVV